MVNEINKMAQYSFKLKYSAVYSLGNLMVQNPVVEERHRTKGANEQ